MMQEPFGITAWKKTPISVFERFPYVCPEPVLVKLIVTFGTMKWRRSNGVV